MTLAADAVLPWGSGMNATEIPWLMNDPDPDKWPVVAWRRHHSWNVSPWADCGMVQFITRMMLGRFEARPLGDASLWNQTDTFVSWREQRRRLLAGLDPQTRTQFPPRHVSHHRGLALNGGVVQGESHPEQPTADACSARPGACGSLVHDRDAALFEEPHDVFEVGEPVLRILHSVRQCSACDLGVVPGQA
ncbi:hypothetical protein [Streptomyces sp. NPDC093594]|uniref:hypothetical protein n=1 Tax=Streptomyces sp. NPDC093594 TaxID=3155305 RepID=UPI003450B263